ncbi:MAG: RIP metalloprotease RseP [Cellvibrionales bacterium TMED49]|nr:MAG: RIP metalloprotease RseP [Cellvibrionales bacterium TMED49]
MQILETLLYTFIALGLLVTIHEFGHFWVARCCGVKVERFSIGFGSALLRWHDRSGTEFVIAALPLGGYVKMLDDRHSEVSIEDKPHTFSGQGVWSRIAIVSAGPLANFFFAIMLFWILFLAGEVGVAPVIGDITPKSQAQMAGFEPGMKIIKVDGKDTLSWNSVSKELFNFIGKSGDINITVQLPDSNVTTNLTIKINKWLRDSVEPVPLRALGIAPDYEFQALNLAEVDEDGAANRAGLMKGDEILMINNKPVTGVNFFVNVVANNPQREINLNILRGDSTQTIIVVPDLVDRDGELLGQIGVHLAPRGKYPDEYVFRLAHTPWSALRRGLEETVNYSIFIVNSLGKLLIGELSTKNLSGPITIAKVAGETGRAGIDNFVRFVAILSIMLGVMNLLPIPVLDGGHLMYFFVEIVKGSPVSDAVQLISYKIGLAMLVSLMLLATFNDLSRVVL